MKVLDWFGAQWEWVKGFFSEETGGGMKASSKRLISLAVTWCFIFTYIRVSWNEKTITDIPATWAMLIAAMLGLAIYANKINAGSGEGPK